MKTKKPEPGSKEFLDAVKSLYDYLPSFGFIITNDNGDRVDVNQQTRDPQNLLVQGRRYQPEKIAWLLETEQWPDFDIGFKNGIDTDFRIENLFEVVTDKQVTITKSGNLYVVSNGSEQVMTTENLDECVQMVRDVLKG